MSGEDLLESPLVFLLWGLWFLSTAAGLMLKGEAAKPACPALVLKMKLGWLSLLPSSAGPYPGSVRLPSLLSPAHLPREPKPICNGAGLPRAHLTPEDSLSTPQSSTRYV